MMMLFILLGLGLIACVAVIAWLTKSDSDSGSEGEIPTRSGPPPLPHQNDYIRRSPSVSQSQPREGGSSSVRPSPPPLPIQRKPTGGAVGYRNGPNGLRDSAIIDLRDYDFVDYDYSNGPNGLRPDQFPCCPFDKQRNISGKQQVIFWDSGAECYWCSRGHRFKSNGKPLF